MEKQYDKIVSERDIIVQQINELDNNKIVKKYLDLCKQNKMLINQQKILYEQMKVEEYSSCNHILIKTLNDYDSIEGRSYNYHGCIKCGLNQKVLHLTGQYYLPYLTFEDRIMYNFMKRNLYDSGFSTKISCDLDLARAVYLKIKKAHPNIDDKTFIKYFEIALDNIRTIKVNDDRKVNRAKRLSLNPKFNKFKTISDEKYFGYQLLK